MFEEYIFDDWFKKIDDLRDAIGKDLKEIHKAKEELRSMRTEMFEQLSKGNIIRDPERIVLSAPEIIIGNVDTGGTLLTNPKGSRVVIRTNEAFVQGVSDNNESVIGKISLNAPIISQKAIDTGNDGIEQVESEVSAISSIARNIVINSCSGEGFFNFPTNYKTDSGISINSDTNIVIDATSSVETRKEMTKNLLDGTKEHSNKLQERATKLKVDAKALSKQMQLLFSQEELFSGRLENDTRTNIYELHDLNEFYHEVSKEFYLVMNEYLNVTSALTESKRQEEVLQKQLDEIDKKSGKFKEETTGTSILLQSETLKMVSTDGDGNLRENPGAGLFYRGKNFHVMTKNYDGSLIKDSSVAISSQTVQVSTADPKRSDKTKADNSENPAVGKVRITSKDVIVEAVDYDVKDRKFEEKALTKDGRISLRAENIDLSSTDKEGKATGKLGLNAKNVDIRATDVKKEKGKPDTDDKLAAGGQLTVSAENVFMGSKSKDNKSKKIQVSAEKVALIADTTIEMQQGEGKSVITLDGGNASLGGAQVEICGDTIIKGGADIKGKIKATVFTAESVEATKSLKGPDTSDSKGAGVAGKAEKISAKLNPEDVKDK